MVTMIRRCLVVAAMMFWQGGFTFYASVVVPIGSKVLGSHAAQGMVTRHVVVYLHIAGAAALALLVWDLVSANDIARWRRLARWGLWASIGFALIAQFWLHWYMDALLATGTSPDPERFYSLHRWYLMISSGQWAASLILVTLNLLTWRGEDRRGQ
ncbi:MAG TPA: hypothetical protein VFE62_27840 [Gemmataceae bacterium]|nr:hypothetical protein [Gemmataceae bacterium]